MRRGKKKKEKKTYGALSIARIISDFLIIFRYDHLIVSENDRISHSTEDWCITKIYAKPL